MKKVVTAFALLVALKSFTQPPNDEPCGAITVPVSAGTCLPIALSNYVGATSSTITPIPGCNWYPTKKDVWYKFAVPVNANVVINTDVLSSSVDYSLAVYSAASCNGPFTFLGCDDDSGPGQMPSLSLSGLSAGITYYVRLWDYNLNNADGQIKMCISFTEPLATSKVGVGTTFPASTLDVNGEITIRGGNPADGKVLTSDNNGKASWKTLPNTSGTTRKLSIPFTAFQADIPGVTLRMNFVNGGWIFFDNGINASNRMLAAVMLPDSVRITKMSLYYADNSSANLEASLDVALYNIPFASISTVAGSVLSSTGADAVSVSQVLSTGPLNVTVKNSGQAYFVKIRNTSGFPWPGSELRVGMVEIEYQIQ
ncbi:MAG: hypothetical protein V4722_07780 [Bacteroidota bacterium]